MLYSFAPTKVRQVSFATNLLIRKSITAMAVDMDEVLIVDMQHWRCLADVIHSHSGTKVFIEQEVPALTRVVNGQTEHARMDLVFNLNGSVTYLDVSIVAPFSCNLSLVSSASTKPGLMAKRAERNKI